MVEYSKQDKQLDLVFHALADSTRRSLLKKLKGPEVCVTDLAAHYDVSLNAISKHLKVLEKANLIDRNIVGRVHLCKMNPKKLKDIEKWMLPYKKFWEKGLDNLEQYLKTKGDKND